MAKKTILLVEDHLGDRNMYGNILWYNGYDVVVAEDGEAGLRLAREIIPDLIILDLQLPKLHGSELLSQLKQDDRTKKIPVVALTGRRLYEFGGNAEVLGFEHFLEKPVSPLQVLRVTEDLIGPAETDQAVNREPVRVYRTPNNAKQPPAEEPAPADKADPKLRYVAEHLLATVGAILARWEDLVREEPWFSLPREHRLDNLSQIVAAIVDVALLHPGDREATRVALMAGATHGDQRRECLIPETMIPIEFHLLRQALWRHLIETVTMSEDTSRAIIAIDGVITTVLNAAMWGYYRPEIDAHGGWNNAIEKLIAGDTPRSRTAASG